jgi:hypothetical protein
MVQFTIQPEQSWFTNPTTNERGRGQFLNQTINAYYHADYQGGGDKWRVAGTIENTICTLKNDITPYQPPVLQAAQNLLMGILREDLPQILSISHCPNLTVCVIPRAKAERSYRPNQLRFKQSVRTVVNQLTGFSDGTDFIIRQTNTKTTHLSRGFSGGGDGNMPYPGITVDTCSISNDVRGRDILLIDDLYTKSVNIDEDAIQALLNRGARTVIFYAIGKTMPAAVNQPQPNNLNRNNNDDLPF